MQPRRQSRPVGSPLLEMTRTTSTRLWNDSANPRELAASIGWGAVGATCNPVIALAALRAAPQTWRRRIQEHLAQSPAETDSEIGWRLVTELTVHAASLLEPVFDAHHGVDGRVSIQTDPRLFRDTPALLAQAETFDQLARNIIVKIPATAAGVRAMEQATYLGISINATVSFSVSQALAVAEAIEQGLRRRESEGHVVDSMGPVCTVMVGRLDDWLRVVAERDQITIDPGYLEWAGVAVLKKAYSLFQARGYRTRLLSAAFRNHMHWSQFVGGNVVVSPPFAWQVRLNASDIEARPRMDDPVDPTILRTLYDAFPDFRQAYDEDGMEVSEFIDYGATRRTLRQFLAATGDLESLVRDVTLPDPDRA